MQDSRISLLTELPGLEAAKRAIEGRIEEIKRLVYGDEASALSPGQFPQRLAAETIRRRTISEETRQQRREFLKKAREVKLARLYALRKGVGATTAEMQKAAIASETKAQVRRDRASLPGKVAVTKPAVKRS
jgi:hypothetical protein